MARHKRNPGAGKAAGASERDQAAELIETEDSPTPDNKQLPPSDLLGDYLDQIPDDPDELREHLERAARRLVDHCVLDVGDVPFELRVAAAHEAIFDFCRNLAEARNADEETRVEWAHIILKAVTDRLHQHAASYGAGGAA